MQIQPMGESVALGVVRRPVAFALAGALAITGLVYAAGQVSQAAVPISGRAEVVDGDTLDVGGRRVRLEGIDAPELGQSCPRDPSGSWSCGKTAREALRKLVSGRRVTCESKGKDGYGRDLAICFAGGEDVNAALVRQGLAWAFVKYSTTYVHEEGQARSNGAGVWQAQATPPWTYRAGKWQAAEIEAPEGCAIKGNISRNGRIYHVPWGTWYGRVRIDTDGGERWFCSEAEALAAGWRPVASSH